MNQHTLTGITLWAIPRFRRDDAPTSSYKTGSNAPHNAVQATPEPDSQNLCAPETTPLFGAVLHFN